MLHWRDPGELHADTLFPIHEKKMKMARIRDEGLTRILEHGTYSTVVMDRTLIAGERNVDRDSILAKRWVARLDNPNISNDSHVKIRWPPEISAEEREGGIREPGVQSSSPLEQNEARDPDEGFTAGQQMLVAAMGGEDGLNFDAPTEEEINIGSEHVPPQVRLAHALTKKRLDILNNLQTALPLEAFVDLEKLRNGITQEAELDEISDWDEYIDRNFRRAHHLSVFLVGTMGQHEPLREALERVRREGRAGRSRIRAERRSVELFGSKAEKGGNQQQLQGHWTPQQLVARRKHFLNSAAEEVFGNQTVLSDGQLLLDTLDSLPVEDTDPDFLDEADPDSRKIAFFLGVQSLLLRLQYCLEESETLQKYFRQVLSALFFARTDAGMTTDVSHIPALLLNGMMERLLILKKAGVELVGTIAGEKNLVTETGSGAWDWARQHEARWSYKVMRGGPSGWNSSVNLIGEKAEETGVAVKDFANTLAEKLDITRERQGFSTLTQSPRLDAYDENFGDKVRTHRYPYTSINIDFVGDSGTVHGELQPNVVWDIEKMPKSPEEVLAEKAEADAREGKEPTAATQAVDTTASGVATPPPKISARLGAVGDRPEGIIRAIPNYREKAAADGGQSSEDILLKKTVRTVLNLHPQTGLEDLYRQILRPAFQTRRGQRERGEVLDAIKKRVRRKALLLLKNRREKDRKGGETTAAKPSPAQVAPQKTPSVPEILAPSPTVLQEDDDPIRNLYQVTGFSSIDHVQVSTTKAGSVEATLSPHQDNEDTDDSGLVNFDRGPTSNPNPPITGFPLYQSRCPRRRSFGEIDYYTELPTGFSTLDYWEDSYTTTKNRFRNKCVSCWLRSHRHGSNTGWTCWEDKPPWNDRSQCCARMETPFLHANLWPHFPEVDCLFGRGLCTDAVFGMWRRTLKTGLPNLEKSQSGVERETADGPFSSLIY